MNWRPHMLFLWSLTALSRHVNMKKSLERGTTGRRLSAWSRSVKYSTMADWLSELIYCLSECTKSKQHPLSFTLTSEFCVIPVFQVYWQDFSSAHNMQPLNLLTHLDTGAGKGKSERKCAAECVHLWRKEAHTYAPLHHYLMSPTRLQEHRQSEQQLEQKKSQPKVFGD